MTTGGITPSVTGCAGGVFGIFQRRCEASIVLVIRRKPVSMLTETVDN